ncbi:DUF2946 family protein [Corticibacter populi]|uniref:DUF2946 family protein n=1 Tax=Corticibacter populi TaxID=1550736 RepID=A0A3M6QLQ2_9BURK|nr:DUF2946 family protein [Corticibacter populi]RMX03439.1 DUF2946 family protein [Corticibacter populi]RZS29874.1 DUF2946 family protein [Corticibacter populi]
MDDIVKQAMAKWPNVPACRGWLGLDARGHWFMRDDATQQRGPFPQSKGAELQHEGLVAFIGRNYACDADGCWYFQNGPQRVYVELESAPWVLRVDEAGEVSTHTGLPVQCQGCHEDEAGRIYMETQRGLGLVHSMDMLFFANALERQPAWQPLPARWADLPGRFGFVRSLQRAAGEGRHAGP